MAQCLKDDVQGRIAAAALRVFARDGFRQATMAGIAKVARVSTGNIYRYYRHKDDLFRAVVSTDFVRTLTRLLRGRVTALRGVDDIRRLPPTAVYHLASEDFLRFCIDNRLRVIVLLGHAQGSCHERFAEEMTQDLIRLAIAHCRSVRPLTRVTQTVRFNVNHIYRSLVANMFSILTTFEDEVTIRAAVAEYSRYHLAGLKSLFDGMAVR